MKLPSKGDKIYIPSSYHISSGSDDVQGGVATIDTIKVNTDLPKDHYNSVFVSVEKVPGHGFNYQYLLEQQDELKKQFKDKIARPDPDIDTPWIQEGDWVDGKKYHGPDVW